MILLQRTAWLLHLPTCMQFGLSKPRTRFLHPFWTIFVFVSVAQPAPGASGCATRRGGGHLSFVVAGNAAGLTATAAGPGSFYGPHQLRLLSLFLSLHSVDYSTDHSSPSETSFTVCEDPIPPKLDKRKVAAWPAANQQASQQTS